MNTTELDQPADLTPVKENEREFFVAWKALNEVWLSAPFRDLIRLEVQRAAETLLYLMRQADCIDPTLVLDGSGHTGTISLSG
jgi:hypothetical protein